MAENMRLALFIFLICCTPCLFAQQNTLDYYLTHAINNSPLLKDYQNQIAAFSLDSQILRAFLRPMVNGISNNMYAPVIGGYGYDEAITNGKQVSGLISVNKSFFSSKTIASQVAGFSIQSQTASNNIGISHQDLKRAITDQYIITYGDLIQLNFNKEINDLLNSEDSLLKKLTQNNVFKQSEYLTFVVTLQQQLLNTSQLEVQYNFDLATLNYLAGIIDTIAVDLRDPQLQLTTLPDYITSVFYRQFVLDSLKLRNDRELIALTYRPKVNVFADAGYNSTLAFQPYRNFGTSFGISITVPIYDGGQRKLQYSKINLQENTRLAKRDFFNKQHDQQILQLTRQLRSTEQLIEQINRQIKYTETLITVNEKLLATGDIRVTDFIITLNNYFSAKNLVAQNYVNRLRIINQLNYWGK